MVDILRPQSEAEKADYLLAGIKDHQITFTQLLMKAEKKHQEKGDFTPYDRNGARFDFEDAEKRVVDDSVRSTGTIDIKKILELLKNFKFEKLEGSSYKLEFELGKGSYATIVVRYLFG